MFTVKLLRELAHQTAKDETYDYESANTNEDTEIEAASMAFQIEHELERQQELEIANLVNYELGFSLVIQDIIKAKKPFIGHNLFLDLLFIYEQFIDDLPPHLDQFMASLQKLFPAIYDTKCMATSLSLFNKTDLNSMSTQIFQTKKFKNYLEFDYDLNTGFGKYLSKTMLHEAGYDSYLTGVCFASMVKYLEA